MYPSYPICAMTFVITLVFTILFQINIFRELQLNGNQITSIPVDIGYLVQLEKLYLQNNKISNVEDEVIDS